MAKQTEMKRKMIEQRDALLAEIEALRNKVKGFEMAISLMDGDASDNDRSIPMLRRSGMKAVVLDLLAEVGTTGLNAITAVEMAERKKVHIDRQSVSSLLSRLKKEGVVVYEGDRYKLVQHASGWTSVLRAVPTA